MKMLKLGFVMGVLGFSSVALMGQTTIKIGEKECFLPMLSCYNDEDAECKKQQSVYESFEKAINSTINPLKYTSYVSIDSNYDENTQQSDRKVVFEPRTIEINGDGIARGLAFNGYGELRDAIECKGQTCTKKAYNDEGILQYEATCVAGVNNGPQRFYDWQGNLIVEINYSNGKPSGTIKTISYSYGDKKGTNTAEIKNGKLNGKIHTGGEFGGWEGGEHNVFMAEIKNGNIMLEKDEGCFDACVSSQMKVSKYNADGSFDAVIESHSVGSSDIIWIKNSKESKFKIPYEVVMELEEANGVEYENVKTWLEGSFNDKGQKHGEWKYTSDEYDEDKGEMITKLKRHEIYENGVRTKILR